tara:strand:- start:29060 stop:30256 length:1197 start_codon:yes stop_codon:yes gene_type:complete
LVERDTHYDSVVIGASPTGLFEAAALAETGAKVLVVDQSDRLGGAWTTLDLPGVGTVECGSHYLIDLPNVYSFLEEVLDIRLVLLDPPPQYILPRRVASRLCVDFTQRWGGKISPRVHRGEVSVRSFRNLASPYYRYVRHLLGMDGPPRRPLKYIVGGTSALVGALERFVEQGGFDIELGKRLEDIDLSVLEKTVRCRVGNRVITAGELVISSCTSMPSILIDGKFVDIPGDIIPSVQLHMMVDGAAQRRLTFVQFSGSDHAILASDLTDSCTPPLVPADRRLLSAYVRTDVPHDTATAQAILDDFKRAGLLEREARLCFENWSRFDLPQRSPEELAHIEKLGGGLFRTLFTHSFSMAISRNAPRWTPFLKQRAAKFRNPGDASGQAIAAQDAQYNRV